jgi:hypothetical protein
MQLGSTGLQCVLSLFSHSVGGRLCGNFFLLYRTTIKAPLFDLESSFILGTFILCQINLYFLVSCFLNIQFLLYLCFLLQENSDKSLYGCCVQKRNIYYYWWKAKDPISLDWPAHCHFCFLSFFLCTSRFFSHVRGKSNRNHVGGVLVWLNQIKYMMRNA